MTIPRWLSNLFTLSKTEDTPDTSCTLQKQAHKSELVQNLLSEPIETEASESARKGREANSCPECGRPNQYGELCAKCTKEEAEEATEAAKAAERQALNASQEVSLLAELTKQAGAYELGDSEAQTANKSHEAQIKSASDFALAEMLTELHLQGQGVQERWHLDFPETLASVKKNRKSAEAELLKDTPPPAVIERMKFLSEIMTESHEKGFNPTESKNLYDPLFEFEGKQTWEKAKDSWNDKKPTDKEQLEHQMPEDQGPGREENDHREVQPPRSTTACAAPPDDLQLVPQNKYLIHYQKIEEGEHYYKWFATEEAAKKQMEDLKEEKFALAPKFKDFSKEFKTPEKETLAKEAAQVASAQASHWVVTVKLEPGDDALAIRENLQKVPGITEVGSLMEGGDHLAIRLDSKVDMFEKAAVRTVQEALDTMTPKPLGKAEYAMPKTAEISSPWKLIKQEGADVIARITPDEIIKASNEVLTTEKKSGLSKEAKLELFNLLASKFITEIETKAEFALTAAEELPEPAESLEGLDPQEQELWKQNYQLAFRWALADPISRKIGRSETRRAAMVALLRAIRSYDAGHTSKAKFESYLFSAVHNELITQLKHGKTMEERVPGRFENVDKPVSESDNMYEGETMSDIIEDVRHKNPAQRLDESQSQAVALEVVKRLQKELVGKPKEFLDLLMQGYNISEIADMWKYTIPAVVRYRKQLADKLQRLSDQVEKEMEVASPLPEEAPEQNLVDIIGIESYGKYMDLSTWLNEGRITKKKWQDLQATVARGDKEDMVAAIDHLHASTSKMLENKAPESAA